MRRKSLASVAVTLGAFLWFAAAARAQENRIGRPAGLERRAWQGFTLFQVGPGTRRGKVKIQGESLDLPLCRRQHVPCVAAFQPTQGGEVLPLNQRHLELVEVVVEVRIENAAGPRSSARALAAMAADVKQCHRHAATLARYQQQFELQLQWQT